MAEVKLVHVDKYYTRTNQVVFDFNLDIKDKEFVVFVGPSGCGKSTTLRMIAGLEDITNGELYIDGVLSNQIQAKDRGISMVFQSYALFPTMSVRKNIGYGLTIRKIPYEVISKKTGEPVMYIDKKRAKNALNQIKFIEKQIQNSNDEIAALNAKVEAENKKLAEFRSKNPDKKGEIEDKENAIAELEANNKEAIKVESERIDRFLVVKDKFQKEYEYFSTTPVKKLVYKHNPKEDTKKTVEDIAEALELTPYLNRKPGQLSGGQRQRVALGRAIARKAKVFLMDEPLSNLDAKLRAAMRKEIISLHKKLGATTIYVTHDQLEAMTMADRIVVMKRGVIQQIGTPTDIYDHPINKFVATFIGSPTMNLIDATVKGGNLLFNGNELLKLNKEQSDKLKEFEGQQVTIGVRAEDIIVKLGDVKASKEENTFTSEATLVEILGNDSIVHFDIGEAHIQTYCDDQAIQIGSKISYTFRTSKVHVFLKQDEHTVF